MRLHNPNELAVCSAHSVVFSQAKKVSKMDGSIVGSDQNHIPTYGRSETSAPHRLAAKLALTEADMHVACRLRHDSYVAHGFIEPRPDGRFTDKYDRPDTARTAIILKDSVPIASVRICLFEPAKNSKGILTMPALEIFPDLIPYTFEKTGHDGSTARAAEASRMVCLPQYANDTKVIWALLRVGKYITEYFGASVSVIAARPRHVPMYKRIGFHQVGEPRQYVGVKFSTALLIAFKTEYEEIQKLFSPLGTVIRNDFYYRQLIAGETVSALPAETETYPVRQTRIAAKVQNKQLMSA